MTPPGTGGETMSGAGGAAGAAPAAGGAPGDARASDGSADGIASDGSSVADSGGAGGASGGSDAGGAAGSWNLTSCNKAMLMYPRIDRNNGVFPPGSCPPPETLKASCAGGSKIKVMAATASAFETGYVHPPEYATDEHVMTRWSSPSGAMAWIRLDLGSEQTFKRIYLLWELAHAADYDLVVSSDGTTWTPLTMVRNGDGFQDIVDVEGKARYLRLNGVRRGATGGQLYGYSLFDFTVCGQR